MYHKRKWFHSDLANRNTNDENKKKSFTKKNVEYKSSKGGGRNEEKVNKK